MPKTALYDIKGKKVGEIELSDAVFNVEVSKDSLHQYVLNYLANQRQGTQSTLTRAEVRGTTKKAWRQKGPGRARHSSRRAPNWTGGGVVFAPKPRDYSYRINKKQRQLAMKSALTSKVLDQSIIVINSIDLESHKTKEAVKMINAFDVNNALLVTDVKNNNLVISAGNIPNVKTAIATSLNAYDILKHEKLVITEAAVRKIEEVYA